MARGILVAVFDFSMAQADEFHDWYDLEHVPEREAVAGFERCERWISVENPAHAVATYDLESLAVLRSEAYRAMAHANLTPWSRRVTAICDRLLRFEGTQTLPGDKPAPAGAGALLLNVMNVDPGGEDDFNAWYDEEHIPALAAVPGTLAARRFRSGDDPDGTHRHLAIYHLEAPEVVASEAWKTAVDTPWSARVRPGFRDRMRILARKYQRSV